MFENFINNEALNSQDFEKIFFKNYKNAPNLPIQASLFEQSRFWPNYELSFENLISNSSKSIPTLFSNKITDTCELIQTLNFEPSQHYTDTVDTFCASLILNFFLFSTDLKHVWHKNAIIKSSEAFNISKIHNRYTKMFDVMIRHLDLVKFIRATSYRCESDIPESFQVLIAADFFINEANLPEKIAEYGQKYYRSHADCFRFPLYCSKYYKNVLIDEMSPLSVIYPKGDLNFMHTFKLLGDELGDIYYNMYLQLIAGYVELLAKNNKINKKIRLLEVGAGMGHVTRQLAPKMAHIANFEYWWTDLGNSFVKNASRVFEEFDSFMKFKVFDITVPDYEQDIHEKFDIIVSYNVIHTTESVKKSTMNLKASLLDDVGVLFIIESARNDTWATLAWGLLDGWWFFKDHDLRPADPMLDHETWQKVLTECQFKSILTFPFDSNQKKYVEKFLFVCCNHKEMNNFEIKKSWMDVNKTKFEINQCDNNQALPEPKNENHSSIDLKQVVVGKLISIWKKRLGLDHIENNDVFKELGGESLLSIQMMHDVKKIFDVDLEIVHVYAYPKLIELAQFIYDSINNKKKSCFGKIILLPGQGSERVGMCEQITENQFTREYIEKAKQILGFNILDVCKDSEALHKTEFIQVALFVCSFIKLHELKQTRSDLFENLKAIAGLSVGEFAALAFSRVISFEDALKVVHKRALLMQSQVEKVKTGMISVFGSSKDKLQNFLLNNFRDMCIANYLGDNQHTVVGLEEDCKRFVERLNIDSIKKELEIIDVRRLRVGGAFHSYYMDTVSPLVNELIDNIKFNPPDIPIIMNYSGELRINPEEIRDDLKKQLVSPVQWRNTIVKAVEQGITSFIEVSPSSILIPIIRNRIDFGKDLNLKTELIKF